MWIVLQTYDDPLSYQLVSEGVLDKQLPLFNLCLYASFGFKGLYCLNYIRSGLGPKLSSEKHYYYHL